MAGWPPVGRVAAHSACDMFHSVGAWLLVWFFPTSVFGVGVSFWLRLSLIFAYFYFFFEHADIYEGAKHPVLLPKDHRYTTLVILVYHEKAFHTGCSQTLMQLQL